MNAINELQKVGDSIDEVKALQDKCLDFYPKNKTMNDTTKKNTFCSKRAEEGGIIVAILFGLASLAIMSALFFVLCNVNEQRDNERRQQAGLPVTEEEKVKAARIWKEFLELPILKRRQVEFVVQEYIKASSPIYIGSDHQERKDALVLLYHKHQSFDGILNHFLPGNDLQHIRIRSGCRRY